MKTKRICALFMVLCMVISLCYVQDVEASADKTALGTLLNENLSERCEGSFSDYLAAIESGNAVYQDAGASQEAVDAAIKEIEVAKHDLHLKNFVEVTSNVTSIYEQNYVANASDNNRATSFWKAGGQTTGDYIRLTFRDAVEIRTVGVYVDGGDYLRYGSVQITTDGTNFTDVAAMQDSADFTISLEEPKTATGLRILCTADHGGNWWKLSEITVNGGIVDKEALKFELDKVVYESDYTSASYASYLNAKESAQAVYDKADATASEVSEAISALGSGIEALANADGSVEVIFEGKGTEAEPYLIQTPADLVKLSELSDEEAAYASLYYKLTADLDMSGITFKPIGITNYFSGVLDGDGHVIKNLTINHTTAENTGLVSYLYRGTIKNLGIESGTITGGNKTGALVGRTMYAKILNCYSKADVTGGNDTGGIAGMFNNSDMENCYAWGKITGATSVGGLTAGVNASPDPSYPANVRNCYAFTTVSGAANVGQITGWDEAPHGFPVNMENIYYPSGTTGVGNNSGRTGTYAVAEEAFTNGELTEKLNANLADGYKEWMEGETGYPEFTVIIGENGLVGKGTATSPYRIKTAEDLVKMQTSIAENAEFADDYYALSNDIDMSGITFEPIGKVNAFSGVFDGKMHKITNLNIENTAGDPTGLFSQVTGGTVKNVGIEGGTIEGTGRTGALIGRTDSATILNCYTTATVTGGNDTGGLVGMFNNSVMENCYARATVTGAVTVGGLIAGTNRSVNSSIDAIVKNCYSTSNVSGTQHIGVVIGYDESTAGSQYYVTMENLYCDSTVVGIGNNDGRTELKKMPAAEMTDGTLVTLLNKNAGEGYAQWLEENSGYPGFEGKVVVKTTLTGEGTEESPYLIQDTEDLLEMARVVDLSKEFAQAHYKLTESLDLGDVEFGGMAQTIAFQGVFDGDGHIIKNINIYEKGSEVTGFFHSTEDAVIKNFGIESGMVRGKRYVGSIVGRSMTTTIFNCFNNAAVRGLEDVGGLVGMLNNSDLLNSYNSGEVIAKKSLGGLAGSVCRSLNAEVETNIINSYNIGHVHWGTYSGKVTGYAETDANMANYVNVYYNKEDVPNVAAGNASITVTGCTEAEMMSDEFVENLNDGRQENYAEWELGADGIARLKMFGEAAEVDQFLAEIEDQPEVKDGKLVLPVSESGRYEAVLSGSTNEQVVALDGTVYQPLTAQKVYLIYDIIDTEQDDRVVARLDRNVVIDVAGKYANSGVNEVPNVVPGLREWYGAEGNFKVTEDTRIIAVAANEKAAAEKTKEYLDEILGIDLEITDGVAKSGDIVFSYTADTAEELGEEGYYITIDNKIVIEAPTETGMFYGGVTISQILYQDAEHVNVPKGIIRDYPQYSVRGGMMDVARKYFELDYVEEMGRYMAWFKMNTFHLHINEDSGLGGEYSSSFVVESKKYPVLNTYNTGYIWSQEDYKQMQKNLKEYGVNVITEIDTPGHATIFDLIEPEIVNGSNFDLAAHYDECLALISSVFDEFLDGDDPVFQSAVVHIGTDESGNTNENMRRYINDLAQYCLSKENIDEVVFWGNLSIYPGETEIDSENVINQVWDSADQRVEEALLDGFKLINSTSNSMYLIPGNSNGLHNGYVDMASFYDRWEGSSDFDTHTVGNPTWIASRNYYADYDLLLGNPQIIGTLFCNWNDRSWANDFDVLDLVLSYIGVISEKCWYGDADRFETGAEFVEAFNKVGDSAPNANPRRMIDTDSSIIAQYDFEEMTETSATDIVNNYDAAITNVVQAELGADYLYGKAAALNANSVISLPFDGVGYPYTVNFDVYLDGAQGENAILFKDGNSTFYLNYEGRGVGYKIGKYGFTFDTTIPTDQWVNVTITSRYVHGSAATTMLKIDGAIYSATMIVHPASVSSHSASSFLGTNEMFTGVKGYLDNLIIGNQYNQSLAGAIDFEFEGEGTEESPYLIKTSNDLVMFAKMINMGEHGDAYFKLANDIDMAGVKYNTASTFSGVFDGNGYVISNLTISEPNGENVGLIGLLQEGTVKDLGIENTNITGKSRVAAIAGRTMYATITNCYAKGTVSGEWDVALIAGMFNNSTMANCYAWGSVSASRETAGGIIGGLNRSLDPATPCVVENCYSNVTVNCPKYAGSAIGYDESSAGENYFITLSGIYYDSATTGIGNHTRSEAVGLSAEEFTNGTLLEKLVSGMKDGYANWEAGENGYPKFAAKPADYSAVDAAIAKVPADLSIYTDESIKALEDALNAVVEGKNITEQATVDGYAKAIEDAIAGLQKKETSETDNHPSSGNGNQTSTGTGSQTSGSGNKGTTLVEVHKAPTQAAGTQSSAVIGNQAATGDNSHWEIYAFAGVLCVAALVFLNKKRGLRK